MHSFGSRAFGALALVAAATFGVARAASATSTDLLAGHGNFEKPVQTSLGTTYKAGQSFDGWSVTANKVSVAQGYPGIMVPPQGRQAVSLVDVFQPTNGGTPGAVCRTIATLAGHRYSVGFLAGIANSGTATIVMKIGSASKSVSLPKGGYPAVFKHYAVTVASSAANARFCIGGSNFAKNAFPVVDAVKVIDLGK